MRRLSALLVCFAVLAAAPAAAVSPAEVQKRLPRIWCGVFTWYPGDAKQFYRIAFDQVSIKPSGLVIAVGVAENHTGGRITRVRFRASIVASTLAATMRESAPEPPSPSYVTKGHYSGRLTPKLDRIDARWIGARDAVTSGRIQLSGGTGAAKFPLCNKPLS